jgi:hypothetical protein
MGHLRIAGVRFPYSDAPYPGIDFRFTTKVIDPISYDDGEKFTRGVALCGDHLMKLADARNHRITLVEDDLVIEAINHFSDLIIINQDAGYAVNRSFNPDLDQPSVPMQICALTLIMKKTVARIEMGTFVYPGCHSVQVRKIDV